MSYVTLRKIVDDVLYLKNKLLGFDSRSDTPSVVNASEGNIINFTTSKIINIKLDATLTLMRPSSLPTKDGQVTGIDFDVLATPFAVTLDPAYFRGNLDNIIPNPLVDATPNTRTTHYFKWNAKDQFYTSAGFFRRDP